MPPLEAWEKYFIPDLEALGEDHNKVGCIACHGGTPGADNMDEAHAGMVKSAAQTPEQTCGTEQCHQDIVGLNESNLHFNLGGYDTILTARGADFGNPAMAQAFDNHCLECHADCGQCHISRPAYAGGGLIAGHQFKRIAPVTITCDGCHGGRVATEYKGRNEGIPADVHWNKGGMACIQCHPVNEMHGDGNDYASRYHSQAPLSCASADCHADLESKEIEQHDVHGDKLACQVCHSAGAYKNCANCHVGTDDQGLPYRTLDPSWLDFKIGRNPNPTEDRPWQYELVRHIPIVADIFAGYGDNLLPTFDALPTWKGTTPHNIQKITPQNETCENCHENPDVFLMDDDVAPKELTANADVIIAELPSMAGTIGETELEAGAMVHPLEGYERCTSCHQVGVAKEIPHPLENRADCFFCHRDGVGEAPRFPGGHNDFTTADCLECHLLADLGETATTTETLAEVPSPAETTQVEESRPSLSEDEIVGIECYECHQPEVLDWSMTTHAVGAQMEDFLKMWEAEGRSTECLRCHTSGYDEKSGEFTSKGIGCEACHGALVEGHGEDAGAVMAVPVDDSVCDACHEFTYSEWRLSAHAESKVSCINCHLAHTQGTRLPKDELCSACHRNPPDSFTHTSHYDQDVSCIDCHMHAPDPDCNEIEGTGAVGHNFFVGTEACAHCHEGTDHVKREAIAGQGTGAEPAASAVATEEVVRLEQRLEAMQENTVSILSMGLGIGGFLGVAVILIVTRFPGRNRQKENRAEETEA